MARFGHKKGDEMIDFSELPKATTPMGVVFRRITTTKKSSDPGNQSLNQLSNVSS